MDNSLGEANFFTQEEFNSTESSAAIESSRTLGWRYYCDTTALDFERKNIFDSFYQYVGHVSSVSQPGDFLTAAINNVSIVVVRDQSNAIRAFANLCRHRAGPLVAGTSGHCRKFVCKYHAWTYDLTGSLLSAPKTATTPTINGEAIRLIEFKVTVVCGLIFVCLGDPAKSIDEVFGSTLLDLKNTGIERYYFERRVVYDVQCNWKVYVDNYMEGYHIGPVHPELNSLLQMNEYSTSINEWCVLQKSPFKTADSPYGRSGDVLYYFLFPNLMLNITPGRLQTNLVIPVGVRSTRIIFDYFYENENSIERTTRHQQDHVLSDKVQKEDMGICEEVQNNLNSGLYAHGLYVPNQELGLYAFHKMLRSRYRLSRSEFPP